MFWMVRAFAVLLLIVLIVLGLGYLLPAERNTTTTTLIDALPDRVYQILTDVEKQTVWRTELRSLTVQERGELVGWTEVRESGLDIRVHETAKAANRQYDVSFETSNGIRGTLAGALESSSEGRTKLTVVETVIVDNPLMRVVCYVFLNLDTVMDTYLGDLNRYASKPPAVEKEPL